MRTNQKSSKYKEKREEISHKRDNKLSTIMQGEISVFINLRDSNDRMEEK